MNLLLSTDVLDEDAEEAAEAARAGAEAVSTTSLPVGEDVDGEQLVQYLYHQYV